MDYSGKTLLIVSGGIEAADAAKRAKAMGLHVVVSDMDPNAPGFAFADSCLIADVYGPTETAAAAERYSRKIRKIDGDALQFLQGRDFLEPRDGDTSGTEALFHRQLVGGQF